MNTTSTGSGQPGCDCNAPMSPDWKAHGNYCPARWALLTVAELGPQDCYPCPGCGFRFRSRPAVPTSCQYCGHALWPAVSMDWDAVAGTWVPREAEPVTRHVCDGTNPVCAGCATLRTAQLPGTLPHTCAGGPWPCERCRRSEALTAAARSRLPRAGIDAPPAPHNGWHGGPDDCERSGCPAFAPPDPVRDILAVLGEPLGLGEAELPAYDARPDGCCVRCHRGPLYAPAKPQHLCIYCHTLAWMAEQADAAVCARPPALPAARRARPLDGADKTILVLLFLAEFVLTVLAMSLL